jgi:hypothetical protein
MSGGIQQLHGAVPANAGESQTETLPWTGLRIVIRVKTTGSR